MINPNYSRKKVFLSSPFKDLIDSREAAIASIRGIDGLDLIAMEEFGSRDTDSLEHCLQSIRECDVFVGILGHRYGALRAGSEDSYSLLEYKEAVKHNKPRILFLYVGPVHPNHIEPDAIRERQQCFRELVKSDRLVSMFNEPGELGRLVSNALFNYFLRESWPEGPKTVLLFPYVSSVTGFNTGLAVTNVGRGPGSASSHTGIVTLYFYGTTPNEFKVHEMPAWKAVGPGQTMTMNLLFGGPEYGFPPLVGFQGHVYAVCNFPNARGFALISDPQNIIFSTGYLAEALPPGFDPRVEE
jgi:hypothetical protein